jgi:isocitrate dehydrogenase (NAD+)
VALRTERITRRSCRAVSEYAFLQAERMKAKVFGGPKYTVSPIYEGMLREEMDAAARRHPDVAYEPQLIDATFALLLTTSGEPLVIPTLNRDGDIMSDLVLQLFGTIAGAESLLLSLDENLRPTVVMAEAPHGTAPRLFGKNLANPMAMILATGSLLAHFPDEESRRAGHAIQRATLETVAGGLRTVDIGGECTTTQFTDAVIERVRVRMEGKA